MRKHEDGWDLRRFRQGIIRFTMRHRIFLRRRRERMRRAAPGAFLSRQGMQVRQSAPLVFLHYSTRLNYVSKKMRPKR